MIVYQYPPLLIADADTWGRIRNPVVKPITPPFHEELPYEVDEEGFITFYLDPTKFIGWKSSSPADLEIAQGFRIQLEGYEEYTFYVDTPTPEQRKFEKLDTYSVYAYWVDMPYVQLKRKVANTQAESTAVVLTETLNIQKTTPDYEKPKGLDKVGAVILDKSLDLRQLLIPAITSTITTFGVTNVNKLLSDPKSVLGLSTVTCPSDTKLLELVTLRNKYTNQVNTFLSSIDRISKITTAVEGSVNIINTALATLTTATTIANIVLLGAITAPGPIVSSQFVSKDLENALKPKLIKYTRNIQYLTSVVQIVVSILVVISKLLAILDELIVKCAKTKNLPLVALNDQLAQLGNAQLEQLQTNIEKYKGFSFEILADTSSDLNYPKRYAVARDKFGVIVLKGESSYTPNPTILIEELKFIIDRDNLKGE
jgi:hypothetical protein